MIAQVLYPIPTKKNQCRIVIKLFAVVVENSILKQYITHLILMIVYTCFESFGWVGNSHVFICQKFADFLAKILIFDELLAFWQWTGNTLFFLDILRHI